MLNANLVFSHDLKDMFVTPNSRSADFRIPPSVVFNHQYLWIRLTKLESELYLHSSSAIRLAWLATRFVQGSKIKYDERIAASILQSVRQSFSGLKGIDRNPNL